MFSSQAFRKIAEKKGDHHILVDLKLDPRLKPTPAAEAFQKSALKPAMSKSVASSLVAGKTYAIGSLESNDQIYYPGDLGLFGCVFDAWKNHWILRTSPADWWFPVACRIAKAVDKAAKPGAYGFGKVRHLFVSHQGKKEISVALPVHTIYDADYDFLFSAFGSEIEKRIKVPEYAQVMQNDFETSGPAQKIASQINLMAGLQEFFTYHMVCCGCGLRGLEMSGTVEDWESLTTKLERVRETLKPIQHEISISDEIRISDEWWDNVLYVFQNLANTRKNPNNSSEVEKFWINILMDTTGTQYVGGGGSFPGRPVQVEAYNGWLIPFLTNREKILAVDLENGVAKHLREELSGWNKVPMNVSLTWCSPPIEDESTLVAGMMGYVMHEGDEEGKSGGEDEGSSLPSSIARPSRLGSLVGGLVGTNENAGTDEALTPEVVPSVEPYHMWAMMLKPDSPLRC